MKLTKNEAIDLAKKALNDIGLWENFKTEIANYFENGEIISLYNGNGGWVVTFMFEEDNWHKGVVNPTLLLDDVEKKSD